ncbi:hypothetical protein GCM10009764_76060 [Nocardia ninae]|uniref:Uncharacterized protein n=1 Tax=Nocardia ninae NBRC 108245 TaxID=1210091 RepID=A0A511MNB9_9NOCA|nr:hypothetical protein NN4_61260 [Nocardia ninae NBRC 108245]
MGADERWRHNVVIFLLGKSAILECTATEDELVSSCIKQLSDRPGPYRAVDLDTFYDASLPECVGVGDVL